MVYGTVGAEGIEKPPSAGPQMVASCMRRGRGCDRARKQRRRHDRGQQRLLVGASKARATPKMKTAARMNSLLIQPKTDASASAPRPRLDDLADLQHAAPVVAVGDLAGDQHEHRHRQELHQPDEAEIEGAAGQRIHLPGDRDAHHHEAERREGARAPIEHEWPVAQDGVRRGIAVAHRGWQAFVGVRAQWRNDGTGICRRAMLTRFRGLPYVPGHGICRRSLMRGGERRSLAAAQTRLSLPLRFTNQEAPVDTFASPT